MKIVLLSGGSGKRLWPLSNTSRSKQFLKFLSVENSDETESMIQKIWRQLKSFQMTKSTIITTSINQIDYINNQIGSEMPILIEPYKRDTFSSIALAAVYLYSKLEVNIDEVITVLPVDLDVDNDFFKQILHLEEVVKKSSADLALIGINPTYPSDKFGYIVPQGHRNNIYNICYFKEKPSIQEAEKLIIEKKAMWNSGVFSFKLKFIINLIMEKGLPISYQELSECYNDLPMRSFDYEVVEKCKNIIAVKYNGKWNDLGTWNTFSEKIHTNQVGKGTICKNSTDTLLLNELDIPVTILGIKNAVVISSPDGILVSNKKESVKLKEHLYEVNQRPMYEEKRWGWYKVLDYSKFETGNEVITKKIKINSGGNLSYQFHNYRKEIWTITYGKGIFVLEDKIINVKQGDVLEIPVQFKHSIKALTDMEFIEVQIGSKLIEEDIVRIFYKWEDIEKHCLLYN